MNNLSIFVGTGSMEVLRTWLGVLSGEVIVKLSLNNPPFNDTGSRLGVENDNSEACYCHVGEIVGYKSMLIWTEVFFTVVNLGKFIGFVVFIVDFKGVGKAYSALIIIPPDFTAL